MHIITYSGGRGRTSGVAPGIPSNLQMVLQGEDSAGANQGNAPTPQNPNRTDISWTAPALTSFAIDHYEVWRNSALYATTPDATPFYSDTAATNCVSGTAGSGPIFYNNTKYLYQVKAVDVQGNKSGLSGSQSFTVYKNGTFNWSGDYSFAGLIVNYNDTNGAPQGGTADISCTGSGTAFPGFQPHAGKLTTEWNMGIQAFNYLQLDVKPTRTGQTWQLGSLRVGDVNIQAQGGGQLVVQMSSYNTPSNGVWSTYKIPLVDILTDWTSGSPAVQTAFYKFFLQDTTGDTSPIWYVDNILFLP